MSCSIVCKVILCSEFPNIPEIGEEGENNNSTKPSFNIYFENLFHDYNIDWTALWIIIQAHIHIQTQIWKTFMSALTTNDFL